MKNSEINFVPLTYDLFVEKTYEFKENTNEISELIMSFITLAKSNFLKIDDIKQRIRSSKYSPKQILFGKIAVEIYERYDKLLKKQDRIDFNDMINQAIDIVKSNPKKYLNKFDYILIDEFQDISNQRMELVKSFVNGKSDTKLFCVGDDWQSIYKFTGSEVKFFVDFQRYFHRPEATKLKINYRCSKTIVNMSNKLISFNKNQIVKELSSNNQTERKVFFYEIDDSYNYCPQRQRQHVLNKIKELISEGTKPEEILVISRFNKCVLDLKIVCGARNLPVESKNKKGIRFYTAHKSKGSEAKHVFILDVVSGTYGFPCEIKDSSVLDMAKNSKPEKSFDEERRLFYVALTRSKEHLYVYTTKNVRSIFLDEISGFLAPVESIGFIKMDQKEQKNISDFNSD